MNKLLYPFVIAKWIHKHRGIPQGGDMCHEYWYHWLQHMLLQRPYQFQQIGFGIYLRCRSESRTQCPTLQVPSVIALWSSTHWGWDKMANISQTTFSNAFFEWKCVNFDLDFTEVYFQGSIQQYSIIGSDSGLAPNRRQAIIWTNDGLLLTQIYVPLGLNELSWNTYTSSLSCWCYDMEKYSAFLALYEENPLVTNGFFLHRTSTGELWCFFCCWLLDKQ